MNLVQIREFATLMAGYAVMLPSIELIKNAQLTDLASVEIETLSICRRIQRIVANNLKPYDWKRMGPPEYFDKIKVTPEIVKQYEGGRFVPTPFLLRCQTIAEKAIVQADSDTINNFACGLGIFSAYIDKRGSFKTYPVLSKHFIFEAFDILLPELIESNGLTTDEAKEILEKSLVTGEKIVTKILKSHPER